MGLVKSRNTNHNNQHLKLNILTFNHPEEEKEFGFVNEKKEGYAPLQRHEFPLELWSKHEEELQNTQYLYSDFRTKEGADYTAKVNLTESTNFAKHFYTHLIRNYFKPIADIITPDFIKNVVLWFEDKENSTEDYTAYKKYALKVYIGRITKQPELVIAFEGSSRVLNQNLMDGDLSTDKLIWVIYKGELHKYEELPDDAKYHLNEVYPVVNHPLREELGLSINHKYVKNKYKRYHDHISNFYKTYLNTPEFKKVIPLIPVGFVDVDDYRISKTSEESNQLLFGEDNTHIIPYYGLKDHGPCKVIPFDHVRMFFICHKDDKDTANKLYTYFKEGFKNFPDLNKFMRIPLNIQKKDQITFQNKGNPIPEIREMLSNRSFNENTRYIAIYISPYAKDESDPEKRQYYYLVKEELLKYNITSQVIEKETVFDPQLNYSLPNIAVAILAKLDGVPWRLKRSVYSELIVGVGAFKPKTTENRYIGSAFCFSNDGRFQGFECYSANNTAMLAGSLRNAVREYAVTHDKVKRLIIHFYKTMRREELNPILNELKDLGLDIPVIIITINKTQSRDLVIFDDKSQHKMPVSGTFVNVGYNQYLLCNNTRYGANGKGRIEGYPFPVKIAIRSTDKSILEESKQIKHLVDQVYQFSRMYWKSVKQQHLPVTIKYPEMVAEIFPHFESNIIPDFGKENLWFL